MNTQRNIRVRLGRASFVILTGILQFCPVSPFSTHRSRKKRSDGFYHFLITGLKNRGFSNWDFHQPSPESGASGVKKELAANFYQGFIDVLFPENDRNADNKYLKKLARQTLRLSKRIGLKQEITSKTGESFEIFLDYLDVYIFPNEIVFFGLKVEFPDMALDQAPELFSGLRKCRFGNDSSGLAACEVDFLEDHLDLLDIRNKDFFLKPFGNKWKLFSYLVFDEEMPAEQWRQRLFELGSCIPVGSAKGHNYWAPAQTYFEELIGEQTISVFRNWTALCLFDSLTVCSRIDDAACWENLYFNIYLHALYLKVYLFKLSNEYLENRVDLDKLEMEFLLFEKHYNFDQISFTFLPQLIYDKVRDSLGISKELDLIRDGIAVHNAKEQERNQKRINRVLAVVSILAIGATVDQTAGWIEKISGLPHDYYPYLSGGVFLLMTAAVLWAFLKK